MRLAALLCSFLLFSHVALANVPKAAEGDAQKAVRYAAALETNPLAGDAKAMRKWLLHWIEETPDYSVTVCDVFGDALKDGIPYGPELFAQQMFGNAAYQIRNPGKHDELELQLAGMESLLKAYAAILAKDPKAHVAYYDKLLEQQAKGELRKFMAPIVEKNCTKKVAPAPPGAI